MEDQQKKIEENIKIVSNLVDTIIKSNRKEKIKTMLENEFGELFFTAPASSKKQYHHSWAGGLVSHSLNVYRNLRILSKAFNCNFNEESMLICALFHDLGKASATDLKTPHYIPTTEQWKINKGWNYEFSDKGVYFPNHQRSMFILQAFGIKLTDEEYQAILLNDGAGYLKENEAYKLKECKLAYFLHISDRLTLFMEK